MNRYSRQRNKAISSVQSFSRVQLFEPHGLQHSRLPHPSQTPKACSKSFPSNRWCHPTISSSAIPLILLPSIFPRIRVFSNESLLHIIWPKYWRLRFSISPSNPVQFRTDFLSDGLVASPCSPRDSQESSSTPQFKSINSSALSFLYSPSLTSIHDYWKNHSFD